MWDMMLYGGAPYSRRYRRSRHSSKKGRKCRACREHIGKVTVGGKKVDMVYCEKHHCQKILTDGTVCQEQRNGRNPLWKYCDLRSDDMPCMKYVKDANPEKFKYCSDHGCKYPHCEQNKQESSKGYCPQHSCLAKPHKTCDQPRLVGDGSFFCEKHTCESATCTAEVDGRGDKGDPSRSCEQHRRCASEGCSGPCFRRDTGATVRWCGLHYCHRDPCPEARAVGNDKYCERHICVEPLCGAGRKDMGGGGRFCADHQCKTEGCLDRRDQRVRGSEHCALHICWVEGCPRPAVAAGNRCDVHRECREAGCREYIFVEKGMGEEMKYPTCEKPTTLTGTQCDNRLDNKAQRYCKDHSCELSSCADQRRPDSLQYCPAHKCTLPTCQQLRKNTIAGLDPLLLSGGGGYGALRASLLLAGRGLGDAGLLVASSYCSAHACQGDGGKCGERVVEVGSSSFCGRHECSRRGCVKEVGERSRKGSSRGGLCDRHYKKKKSGGGVCGGGGGGGGPPVGPFGPMGMPMGFPPFLGGQVYDSSDSESDSDDERRPRGLPFGGSFF
ncbi:hypothetical protein VM1G_03146 [Cytospora mali]|uniref:WRKY transcription factor 19 n=1 Tax=Cytospora mali TaxID=578113 RepID=A0A194VUV7_CYTMA|nr:hypothetical protein VM1G_03146 [Valsa mali]